VAFRQAVDVALGGWRMVGGHDQGVVVVVMVAIYSFRAGVPDVMRGETIYL